MWLHAFVALVCACLCGCELPSRTLSADSVSQANSLCVAACCSVLQRVAVCCSLGKSRRRSLFSMYIHIRKCMYAYEWVKQDSFSSCSVSQCVAVCCSMLQCVVVCSVKKKCLFGSHVLSSIQQKLLQGLLLSLQCSCCKYIRHGTLQHKLQHTLQHKLQHTLQRTARAAVLLW